MRAGGNRLQRRGNDIFVIMATLRDGAAHLRKFFDVCTRRKIAVCAAHDDAAHTLVLRQLREYRA